MARHADSPSSSGRTRAPGDAAPARARTDLATMLFYGVGGVPNSMKTILAGQFGLFFYTSVMGLSGTLVGLAAAIGLAWDALIDPYIGHLSDRARHRLGRRHGLMLVGALTMGVGFWASFAPPRGMSSGALFAWLLLSGILVRSATSVFWVPYLALGAELSEDYHERTRITGIRSLLALVGMAAAASLSFVLFFPNREDGLDPKLDYGGYPWMGLTFGLVMTATALLATLGTLSRRSSPPLLARTIAGAGAVPGGLWDGLASSFRSSSFRALFASVGLLFLGVAIHGTLGLHFLTYYVDIHDSSVLGSFQLAFFLAALIGVVFWLRVARYVDKHRVYLGTTLATAAFMLAPFLLMGEGHVLGTGNEAAVLLAYVLVGFFGSAASFVPASLLADVVDEAEAAEGERREGSFFGLYSLGEQLAVGLSLLLAGVLVDRFAGLVPGRPGQSDETVWRIGFLHGVLPALLLLLAAASISRYRLDRERLRTIQDELARRG